MGSLLIYWRRGAGPIGDDATLPEMMTGMAREAGRALLDSTSISDAAVVLVVPAAYLAYLGMKNRN